MVAKGLLLEPVFVSSPFVATYQVLEKPVAELKARTATPRKLETKTGQHELRTEITTVE